MQTRGWLFDLYPAKRGMVLWWITEAGERLRLEDPFTPAVYAEGTMRDLTPLIRALEKKPSVAGLEFVTRRDLVSDETVEVLQIALADPTQYPSLPLAFCALEHEGGVLKGVECRDDPWALEYALPPLRIMAMRGAGPVGRFSRRLTALQVTVEGDTYELLHETDARQRLLELTDVQQRLTEVTSLVERLLRRMERGTPGARARWN